MEVYFFQEIACLFRELGRKFVKYTDICTGTGSGGGGGGHILQTEIDLA